jgi:hypothetical protein
LFVKGGINVFIGAFRKTIGLFLLALGIGIGLSIIFPFWIWMAIIAIVVAIIGIAWLFC